MVFASIIIVLGILSGAFIYSLSEYPSEEYMESTSPGTPESSDDEEEEDFPYGRPDRSNNQIIDDYQSPQAENEEISWGSDTTQSN